MFRRIFCVVLLSAALPVEASFLCAPKKGEGIVKIRQQACKANEQQLDPVALGLQGPPGPKGEKGDPGPQGFPGSPAVMLAVYDANDIKVGETISITGGEATVRLMVESVTFFLRFTKTQFIEAGIVPHLVYESNNCLGTPFFSA